MMKRYERDGDRIFREERTVEAGPETQVDEITKGKVEEALKKMKRGKATGPDDIPVEAWRVLGYTAVDVLLKVLTHIFEQEKMLEKWKDSILIPIFKKEGDIFANTFLEDKLRISIGSSFQDLAPRYLIDCSPYKELFVWTMNI